MPWIAENPLMSDWTGGTLPVTGIISKIRTSEDRCINFLNSVHQIFLIQESVLIVIFTSKLYHWWYLSDRTSVIAWYLTERIQSCIRKTIYQVVFQFQNNVELKSKRKSEPVPSCKSWTTSFAVSLPSFNVLRITPVGPVLTQPQQYTPAGKLTIRDAW